MRPVNTLEQFLSSAAKQQSDLSGNRDAGIWQDARNLILAAFRIAPELSKRAPTLGEQTDSILRTRAGPTMKSATASVEIVR